MEYGICILALQQTVDVPKSWPKSEENFFLFGNKMKAQ